MPSRALHLFSLATAAATLLLIVAGGLVTSHGVGMAVPDWPNTYGYNMFFFPISQWMGGIFYEHTHRLAASAVGLATGVLALWLHGRRARGFLRWLGLCLLVTGLGLAFFFPARRHDGLVLLVVGSAGLLSSLVWPRGEPAPRWMRRLGLIAFGGVVVQGVLGGLRVVLFQDEIGILHAALAQLFFVLICAIALFTSRSWQAWNASPARERSAAGPSGSATWWLIAGTGLIFLQLVLGATMRHQHAGLAIPDFPLAYGRVWPAVDAQSLAAYNGRRLEVTAANPITAFHIGLQMAHRILALVILAAVTVTAWSLRRHFGSQHFISRLGLLWAGLIFAQALLGAATIWSNKAADVATGHVMVGALSLALGALLCIVSVREFPSARRVAGGESFSEPGSAMLPGSAPAGGNT